MKRVKGKSWGAIVSKLLPGDHIHYTATQEVSLGAKLGAIEEAQLKRMRKQQKARSPK